MEPSFLLLSPLPNWRGAGAEFAPNLGIRRLTQSELGLVGSGEDGGYCLYYEFDNPYAKDLARHRKRLQAAFRLLLHAVYAIQVMVPCGWTGVFLLCRRQGEQWIREATERRQPLLATDWGQKCIVPATFAAEAPALLERIVDAFLKPVLRLQIPIWLQGPG